MIWNFLQFKNNIAFKDEFGNELTYGQLEDEGKGLLEAVKGRSLVFCLCSNTIGSVFGYVSFVNNGIVPVMLNGHLERNLLDNLLNVYSPQYLWVNKSEADNFDGMESIYQNYGYCLLKTGYENRYPLYGKLAILLTTSGSTGSPKFVRQSYGNIKVNTEKIVEYLEIGAFERPVTTLPMNYTYGLSIINTHLYVGATILLTDKGLMQKEFWSFFKNQEATSFGGVPYTYEMLDKLRFYRMDLPSLQTMTQAGGKLTPELHEKFAKYASDTGRKFVVMYGQCEATARMGYLPPEKAIEKTGSMGIAIPGGKFTLIGVDGKKISTPYTTGELIYEGENVTLGYAECGDDLIKDDERHGVLKTGDMAQFDEDGYYYIVGRKKRFLKIFGNRVNLDEMDRLIKGEFDMDAACDGVDDNMYIFVTREGVSDSVKNFIMLKTGLNPAAFKVIVIDEIPRNDSGKTLYKKLARYYRDSYA